MSYSEHIFILERPGCKGRLIRLRPTVPLVWTDQQGQRGGDWTSSDTEMYFPFPPLSFLNPLSLSVHLPLVILVRLLLHLDRYSLHLLLFLLLFLLLSLLLLFAPTPTDNDLSYSKRSRKQPEASAERRRQGGEIRYRPSLCPPRSCEIPIRSSIDQ
jgi:hypothetical protein